MRTLCMRRKTMVLLLCLLMLASMPSVGASTLFQVQMGSILYDRAEELSGIAVVDGILYLLSYGSLLRWKPGDETVTQLAAEVPFEVNPSDMLSPVLLSDGQSLWRFEPQAGRLQQLAVSGEHFRALTPIQLDWRYFIQEGSSPRCSFLHQGSLWMILEMRDGQTRLLSCRLEEGAKPVRMKICNFCALAPMQDGKLLALQHDMSASDQHQGREKPAIPASIGEYDPAIDRFTPFCQVDLGAFSGMSGVALLSLQDDTEFFLAAGDKLWRISRDGGQELCGMLPGLNFLNSSGAVLWVLDENNLYVAGRERVLIKSRNPADLKTSRQLHINADFITDRRALEQIALNMGNTSLHYAFEQTEKTQEELATAFLLNEVHSDVLVMDDYSFDLESLGKKGYLLDLSVSPALREYAEALDPKLQPFLWQDGRLVMVPYRAQFITPTAHETALQELGLEVPGDFFALCDLVEEFARGDLISKAPQGLFDTDHLKESLVRFGTGLYFQTAHATGKTARFDDPLFRKMMERVQQLGSVEAGSCCGSGEDSYPLMTLWNGLDTSWIIQEGDYQPAFNYFAVAVDKGLPPAVQAHFTMLAVNSRTEAPEQAIHFLEEVIATVDPRIQVLLRPDAREPIPNPDYLHDLVEERRRLTMYEDIANKAQDRRMQRIYQEEAMAVRIRLQDAETTLRYLENRQTVAAVREIAQYLMPQTGLMRGQMLALCSPVDLISQYARDAISLEQFIRQADNKLRLVEIENQP
jgi:hypothetical protein